MQSGDGMLQTKSAGECRDETTEARRQSHVETSVDSRKQSAVNKNKPTM